jgi:hypothetical protein
LNNVSGVKIEENYDQVLTGDVTCVIGDKGQEYTGMEIEPAKMHHFVSAQYTSSDEPLRFLYFFIFIYANFTSPILFEKLE